MEKKIKIIYKKTGKIEPGKPVKVIAFLRRTEKGQGRIIVGSSPTEVTEQEYEVLKKKYGDDVVKVTKNTKLPEPIEFGAQVSHKAKAVKPTKKKSKKRKT